jgi:hypothetical protein
MALNEAFSLSNCLRNRPAARSSNAFQVTHEARFSHLLPQLAKSLARSPAGIEKVVY